MSKLLNNFFWLFGTQFFNTLINFLFAPFLSRSLSYDEYASYGQVNIVTDLSISLLSLGISSVIITYLHHNRSKNGSEENEIFNSTIYILLLLGILGSSSIFFSGSFISSAFENDITNYLKIACINIPLVLISNVFNSFLIYQNLHKRVAIFLFITNLLKVLMVFLSIQYFHNLQFVFFSILFSNVLLFVLYFISMPYKVKKTPFSAMKKIRALIVDGFIYYLTGLLGVLLFYIDGIIVSSMLTTKDFSIYRNGAFEIPLASTIYSTIGLIILPEVSKLFSENNYERIVLLKNKVINTVACVIFPVTIFIFLFNRELITLYLGDKYIASSNVFWIYNILLLVRINDYADILIASRNYKFMLRIYLVTFLVNILACFVFTYYFGIVGAAVSTVFSVVLVALFQSVKTAKLINTTVNNIFGFRQLFYIFMIPLILSFLLKLSLAYTYLSDIVRLIIGSVFILINYYIYIKLNYIDEKVIDFIRSKLNKYGFRFVK